jgi:signal peptide peptidase SppA
MKSLQKDIKSHRPVLIKGSDALAHIEAMSSVTIPAGAKVGEMTEILEAVFGPKAEMEKFPPYAVIPLKGVVGKGVPEMETYCGCCDLEEVEEMLEDAERDESVKVIILAIDSPGGVSVGVPEFAARVRNSRKRIIAFTDTEACSAAYWIGSQASEFFATPSSQVGSIGCYITYLNASEAYRKEGYRMEVYKSGDLKGAGIDGTDLTEAQKKMLTDQTVEIHEDFKADVLSVRSFVPESAMQGQCFSGKKAAEVGLVTGLVNGFDELMQKLDPEVAAQMEADEGNDARAAGESAPEETASARALSGLKFNTLSKSVKASDDEEDDDDDRQDSRKAKSEEDEEKPESREDEGQESAPAQPKADEDEEEGEDEEAKSEDDEEEKKQGDGEEKAEDESDSGDDAVDTDEKHDRQGTKRNRSKGVA